MKRLGITALFVLAGCAHAPTKPVATAGPDAAELFAAACEPGSRVDSVKGSVWLKAKSADASGQFPAEVSAVAPGELLLEVTNLLGGTEARIRVNGRRFRIEVPGKPERDQEGYGYWGGIPLVWGTSLFLGRIPCPSEDSRADATVSKAEDKLVVETKPSLEREPERFTYSFRKWAGRPWAESLRWERRGTVPLTVEFSFDDPDDRTHSPKKWEARSAQGDVKVRWKDREVKLRPLTPALPSLTPMAPSR